MAAAERLVQQLEFVIELDRVKTILRQSSICDRSRRENDAEHMWHLAVMALVLAEHAAAPVDVLKVLTMVLVHDVVEIDAGDAFVYDAAAQEGKAERERLAADRIFGLLPSDQAAELRGAWEEFEAKESAEARFAAALDRLQPLLLNRHSGGEAWRRHGITSDRVLALNEQITHGSPVLWELAQRVIAEAVELGILDVVPAAGAADGKEERHA